MKPSFPQGQVFLVPIILIFAIQVSNAQNKTLGVGVTTPNQNAALHVESPTSNQGLILPRLTTAQRTAMAGLPLTAEDVGLMVYDKDENQLYIWNGLSWQYPAKGNSKFIVSDPLSADTALSALSYSNQLNGYAISGIQKGTGDAAGFFKVSNPANTASAVFAETAGTGASITGQSATGSAGVFGNVSGNGHGIMGQSTGIGGHGGTFLVNNPSNTWSALNAETFSANGSVATFRNSNADNTASVLKIENTGNSKAIEAAGIIQGTTVNGLNTGVGGAGNFTINNPANNGNALIASTNGTGYSFRATGRASITSAENNATLTVQNTGGNLAAFFQGNNASVATVQITSSMNTALTANNIGTSGGATNFEVEQAANGGDVMRAVTLGTGVVANLNTQNTTNSQPTLQSRHDGVGPAGRFEITNASNSAPAISILNAGTGYAITANRPIEATQFIGDGSLLTGLPGLSLPYSNSFNAAGNAFFISGDVNAGTLFRGETSGLGAPAVFAINNPSNTSAVINSITDGGGSAYSGTMIGTGRVASFSVSNATNNAEAMFISTNGLGNVTSINSFNASNTVPALTISHAGTGNAITANRPIQATQFIGDGSNLTNLPVNAWGLSGTAGTVDGSNFIGTTDNVPFDLRVNNQRAGRIDHLLFNSFLGYQAGNSTTTGRSNAAFGHVALVSNTTGSDNVVFGANAMMNNVAGSGGTAFGKNALQYANNTTTAFTNNNVAIGLDALRGSTTPSANTGNNNTAIGAQAMQNNVNGGTNVAVGTLSMNTNTSGSQNTAVGFGALRLHPSGTGNTAVGFNAMQSSTVGSNNTAYGYNALANNAGNFNAAMGTDALGLNTSGTQNNAMGVVALGSNTIGTSNTAAGYQALYANTTGNNNSATGYRSMWSNATGSNNTGFGSGTDVSVGNLTNATALGSNAIVNASNKVRIGDLNVTVIEGQVAFTAASDKRFKKDIRNLDEGSAFIMKLRPVSYLMTGQQHNRRNWGFIAQEIEALVGTDNSILTIGGDSLRTLGLRYTDFIAPLVKTAQEQQQLIKILQSKIQVLTELAAQQESALHEATTENTLMRIEYDKRLKKLEDFFYATANK